MQRIFRQTAIIRVLRGRIIILLCLLLPGPAFAGTPPDSPPNTRTDTRCVTEDDDCIFAVFPYASTRQLSSTYSDITTDLSLVMDNTVRLQSSKSIKVFLQRFSRGDYDIALTSNVAQLRHGEKRGYQPIARRALDITFEVITLEDSDIQSLEDLRGKTLGLTDRNFTTPVVVTHLLQAAGIDRSYNIKWHEISSQPTCAYVLLSGIVDACGIASPILQLLQTANPGKFRSISRSALYPNALYVIHPGVPEKKRREVAEYLSSRPGFEAASSADLDPYRKILRDITRAPPVFE